MHTGDLATMDAEGYVNIVGRIKDMIIRGGENVYPREIEEFLFKHPAVQEAQVCVLLSHSAFLRNVNSMRERHFQCVFLSRNSIHKPFPHPVPLSLVFVGCVLLRAPRSQVFGIPDARLGEEVCAWVKLREGHPAAAALTEDALRAHCRANIAHFKVPKHVRFVTEFPMTVSGKAQKFLMRDAEIKARHLAEVKTA